MTLQELVQYKRAALELKQSEYLAQSRTLFIEQLVKLLGIDLVESIDLTIKSRYKCLVFVDIENVQATFNYGTTKFLIQLENDYFNICKWNGTSDITHDETWKLTGDIRSSLVNYLANIKPFHNNEI
jgi:hypothetical protein